MSSRILCCASEGSFNIRIPTKFGKTELQGSNPGKASETMMLSMESRLNSSGTSSWDTHQKLPQEEFCLCQCSMTSSVTDTTTKMNVQGMLVLENGHLLDQVLKRSGVLPRTVRKENGTILRKI